MTMGLANYQRAGDDAVHAGLVVDGLVYDFDGALSSAGHATMAEVFDDWPRMDKALREKAYTLRDGLPVSEVTLLAPSLRPGSLYFAGFNYRDHVANMMKAMGQDDWPDPKSLGLKPWHNLKPRNTLCGHLSTVKLPTDRVDWEVELAVIIGRPARDVSIEAALDYVAGYTVGVDLSARDLAFRPHTPVDSVARMDWIAQKGFQDACPLGPWMTPAFEIEDPQALNLSLSVSGVMKQDSSTRHMMYSVAEAVSHLSSMITLSPGDIILSGTPAGTGAETGEALAKGDIVRATVEKIGELVFHTS